MPIDIAITELLPHRGDMLLIEEILELDEQQARTRSTVRERWPMADQDGVQALILVELAAQTAGVNNGWQMRRRHGADANHRGWIVGIKSAHFDIDRLPLGAQVIVAARNQFEFEGFREIEATASIAEKQVARIVLQLMQADET